MKSLLLAATFVLSATAFAQNAPEARLCATAYSSENYEHCEGSHSPWCHQNTPLELTDGAQINDLRTVARGQDGHTWDNAIASVVVEPGCELIGFQYRQFNVNENYPDEGIENAHMTYIKNFHNAECSRYENLYYSAYKSFSSVKCTCIPEDQIQERRHHHHAWHRGEYHGRHHHHWDGGAYEN